MTRTAQDVEREVEASRSDLDRDVEALKDKMNPSNIIEEASRAMSGSGEKVMAKVMDQIGENPVPLALMGLGLAWLIAGSAKRAHDRGDRYSAYDEPRSFASDGSGRGGMQKLADKAGDAMSGAKDRLAEMGSTASGYAGRAKGALSDIMENEPLVVGAVGLVIGAAIGASLPHTDLEDRTVGPMRDQVVDKGKEMAQEGLQQASDVAQAAYSRAKEELQKPAGDDADPAQRAGDAARAAVKAGKDQLDDAGSQPMGTA
jgi:hypothetical protein